MQRSLGRRKPCCSWLTSLGRRSMDCSREDATVKGGELPWQRPCHNSDVNINDNPAMAMAMSVMVENLASTTIQRKAVERQISYDISNSRLDRHIEPNQREIGNWTCIKPLPKWKLDTLALKQLPGNERISNYN